jgi:hypothetical protein
VFREERHPDKIEDKLRSKHRVVPRRSEEL